MAQPTVENYFRQECKTLGSLFATLKVLQRWNSWLNECLPQEKLLLEHCHIVKLDGTSLIVMADNPHWVTRFRFFIPGLLTMLRNYPDFKAIKAICCKVKPHYKPAPRKTKRSPLKISANSAELFRDTASKIKNEKLRRTLEKIAQRSIDAD